MYLEAGSAFVNTSLAQAALSRPHLDAVDGCKAALESQDRLYNSALDQLEVGRTAPFLRCAGPGPLATHMPTRGVP